MSRHISFQKLQKEVGSFVLTLFLFHPLTGQSLERQVLSASGTTYAQAGFTLDFTLGELATTTYAQGLSMSEGFHQVWALITATESPAQDLELTLYPNPTPGFLNVETAELLSFKLASLDGRVLMQGKIEGGKSRIDVGFLGAGLYLLCLQDATGKKASVFKFSKVE